jgi:membrane protein
VVTVLAEYPHGKRDVINGDGPSDAAAAGDHHPGTAPAADHGNDPGAVPDDAPGADPDTGPIHPTRLDHHPDPSDPDGDQASGHRAGEAVDAHQTVPGSAPTAAPTEPWHVNGSGPVPTGHGRVRHRWRRVAARTVSKAWGDSLFGMSSQAAFWCALSTAPLLLALLGLSGYVARLIGPDTMTDVRGQITVFLHTIFNQEVADNLIGNTVDTILTNNQADVVSVGLIISLWAGSSALTAFVEAINIAYCQHEFRHPVVERFFALGLYVGALTAGIVVVPLLPIGPDYLPRLFPASWQSTVVEIIGWVYYPGLAIGMILLLTTLYKVAPKRKHRWNRGLPGAFLASAVFLVTSAGLRLYLSYVYSHGLTYGALATPITFLLFYYFASMAIIVGAQFNNALLEYYPPRRSHRAIRGRSRPGNGQP